ncbi:MAG: laminin G domain-containing protein [Pirellulales bacterium]|nr:laminin G domain-containing protein [Pirellulales bacterium]
MRRTVLSGLAAAILLMVATIASAQLIPPSDVIVHYPFGDDSGTAFQDAGANNDDATFYRHLHFQELPAIDASHATVDPGAVDTAVALGTRSVDGVNHDLMIGVPLAPQLPGSGDSFAVSFWLNLPSWTTSNGMIASYNYNGLQWTLGQHGTRDAVLAWSSDGDAGAGTDVFEAVTASLPANAFAHFLVQFEGTSGVTGVYVNGNPVVDAGTTSPFFGNDNEGFRLGGRVTSNRNFTSLTGLVDDFAIIPGTVTAGQVASIIGGGVAGSGLTTSIHYALDETTGSVVADSSGHGNDGILVGYDAIAGGSAPRDVGVAVVAGAQGSGAAFGSGFSEHARIESPTDMPGAGEAFTAVFWLKSADWINVDGIVAAQNLDGFGFTIGLHNASDGILVRTTNDTGKRVVLSSLPTDEFAHFAVVVGADGMISAIYVNGDAGALLAKGGYTLPNAESASLAARITNSSPSTPFNGVIDDFALLRGALNETQIEQIMQQGVAGIVVPEPSVLALLAIGLLVVLCGIRRARR